MGTGRRLALLLLALALIGVPAVVLRIACVGASCRPTAEAASAPAPFCSLPSEVRSLITAGTYEERSPDVMAVTASTPVVSDIGGGVEVPWPSTDGRATAAMTAPLWFLGTGIREHRLPSGITLDQVAPTLEPLLGLRRPHPDVRSGTAIEGVRKPHARTPLVVLISWKGIGTRDARSFDRALGGNAGVGSAVGTATAGSLPLDPIAVEATIGTGGLPAQHGITGTSIRGVDGRLVTAFARSAPQPVIAALGDDLDDATDGATRIGLVATARGDEALTGDDWYGGGADPIVDRTVRARPGSPVDVGPFLDDGWGTDAVPDLLAIGLAGSLRADDRTTNEITRQVLRAVPHATVVVAGTGSLAAGHAVEAPTPAGTDEPAAGGLFVGNGTPAQSVVDALEAETAPGGAPLFADAFASYAVTFGSYC
jgi:hypothetical protein